MIIFDHGERVTDHSEVSETKKVHLEKSKFLNSGHVELSGYALFRRIERHIFIKRHLRDNDACSMGRSMPRKSFKRHRKIEHLLYQRLILISAPELRIHFKSLGYGYAKFVWDSLCDRIAFSVRRIKRTSYIPYGGLRLQCSEGYDLRHLVSSCTFAKVSSPLTRI